MSYMFFFFKQKTAYEMRISDWSSDVCSSDLVISDPLAHLGLEGRVFRAERELHLIPSIALAFVSSMTGYACTSGYEAPPLLSNAELRFRASPAGMRGNAGPARTAGRPVFGKSRKSDFAGGPSHHPKNRKTR